MTLGSSNHSYIPSQLQLYNFLFTSHGYTVWNRLKTDLLLELISASAIQSETDSQQIYYYNLFQPWLYSLKQTRNRFINYYELFITAAVALDFLFQKKQI